ncbi:MAG TPA: OmpA family protein [Longimicrobiales bacterium]|nr:OmpA family protein [Longimicrobiales bacterium]
MHRSRTTLSLAATALLWALQGCVTKGTHQAALNDLARARETHEQYVERMQAGRATRDEEAAAAAREHEATERALRTRIDSLEAEKAALEERVAELRSWYQEAQGEVHRLEVVMGERGEEYQRLQERLRNLAAVESEVRERNRIYEEVIGRFRGLIDAGQLSVSIQRGRMVIQLPQDVLFASGSATLGAEGRRTLQRVGEVLSGLEDRAFQVEGHTDNVPISTERFPSNWELSSARALSVVRVLVEAGVPAANLSGAGYGEHQPVASNDDAEGRRRNRRIEIVMLPNLDVIAGAQVPG